MIDVVTLGEILIDFTCNSLDDDRYPLMQAHAGGAVANFLAVNSKFGLNTAFIGKVGNDTFGTLLVKTLEKNGINTEGVVMDKNVFTTLAFVTLSDQGDRDFAFARKPGADTMLTFDEVNLSLIERCKAFHFGTLSLTNEPCITATKKVVEYAKNLGKLITFDPNLRLPLWEDVEFCKQQMKWGLSKADVVKISEEEVEFLFGLNDKDGAKYILENYGVKLIFVTKGANGVYATNGKVEVEMPALQGVKVIDTTGCGDIFGGSALYKILSLGKSICDYSVADLKDVCRFATVAAGLASQKFGGIPSIPNLNDVIEKLEENL